MTNSARTIYVDMDDVICQTARRFLDIVEREFGKRVAYEQLTNFDIGQACNLQPAERDELYRIVHQNKELLNLAPIGQAIDVLRRWAATDYEIAIVTGRPPECEEVSLVWLARHRVPFQSFTMVDKYGRFATANTSAITLDELRARQYCWAVEDSLPMAHYLAAQMAVPVALIDCPWNRSGADHANIARCADWHAIASIAERAPLTGTKK
ncbi:MAG: bifunctional metallophosphatase/5'-nucleotidase [Deltaproteobacteria bacterium]|nr:bifunctional metallophosphatase/5'-nucleotidase [Deltaproteobacteria bacterium]